MSDVSFDRKKDNISTRMLYVRREFQRVFLTILMEKRITF